jgi:hypothetical protein
LSCSRRPPLSSLWGSLLLSGGAVVVIMLTGPAVVVLMGLAAAVVVAGGCRHCRCGQHTHIPRRGRGVAHNRGGGVLPWAAGELADRAGVTYLGPTPFPFAPGFCRCRRRWLSSHVLLAHHLLYVGMQRGRQWEISPPRAGGSVCCEGGGGISPPRAGGSRHHQDGGGVLAISVCCGSSEDSGGVLTISLCDPWWWEGRKG